ncbi:dipeptidase [Pelagibacterium limicola]|uniref:dipeptidase n=1 Tax=Pelagibacterium limicola TaxID=2791022 RepID=UPI0018AF56CF|nr:dipeptidase [Pelagibacterium limicola]
MTVPAYPVFDGHNDTLLRLFDADLKKQPADFFAGIDTFHIDMPKAKKGRFAGGLFAMFTTNPEGESGALAGKPVMGAPIKRARAEHYTFGMMDKGDALVADSKGAIRLCKTATEIRTAMADGAMAMVYHIEGAEVIDTGLEALDTLYARGLRSVGIVWSRNNAFGYGVPFSFPGDPDYGEGLTRAGFDLVRACNRLGLMIDLSHLNEKGFWDVARTSDKPLVASHSNVHALSASPRNLTDRQLDAIAESRGLVGLNFACGFLRPDGQHVSRGTTLDMAIRHLDRMIEKLGEDGVGIGSDFDGCTLPEEIGDASGLPRLVAAMARAGYGSELIARITHRNWIGLLERTWGK